MCRFEVVQKRKYARFCEKAFCDGVLVPSSLMIPPFFRDSIVGSRKCYRSIFISKSAFLIEIFDQDIPADGWKSIWFCSNVRAAQVDTFSVIDRYVPKCDRNYLVSLARKSVILETSLSLYFSISISAVGICYHPTSQSSRRRFQQEKQRWKYHPIELILTVKLKSWKRTKFSNLGLVLIQADVGQFTTKF